jgi:type I site-specific restriction-modification system R (restriction) subunit
LLYARDASERRFHTVVLLIDRIKLDEQVGDSVERFLRRNGIDAIHRATSIDHLAELLAPPSQSQAPSSSPSQQQRVIISTIQKIGLLAKNKVLLTRLLHGHAAVSSDGDVFSRIAIITDEAHRSHTAATRHTIEAVMNASDESDENPVAVRFPRFSTVLRREVLSVAKLFSL